MILCLDVGNSQIYGGVMQEGKILRTFRHSTATKSSSDELGLFLRSVLRENGTQPEAIDKIAISSVVPDLIYSLKNCCRKYFDLNPFVLQAGVKTGLKIKYRNPIEVGADRIANSIAAIDKYPAKNIIIVDFGTATTFCAISNEKDYLGGAIIPGLRVAMESLEARTAKLPTVEIVKSQHAVGRSTVESIQSGLYYSHLFTTKGMIKKITEENFSTKPIVIGTGGFARLYENENLFDDIKSNLVLEGLYIALKNNM